MGNPQGGTVAAAKAYGAIVSRPITNKCLKLLMRIHSSKKMNSLFELPFKGIWDRVLFDTSSLNRNDEVYFLFYELSPLSISRNYLNHLRRKYKHGKLIYAFVNPAKALKAGRWARWWARWSAIRSCYDYVITFNRIDAEQEGLIFLDYWPSLLPEKTFQPENASDVFFIGRVKDRLPKILDVYERLADAGLKCDFHITGVPKAQQKYADVIHYYEDTAAYPMSYDQVLQSVKNTKCVLEILPLNQNYSSLRVCEALWYRKKLLTTNQEAPQEWFYNPEFCAVFSEAEDIDPEFVAKPFTPEDEQRIFGSLNIGDFGVFADNLLKHLHQ